MYVAGLPGVSDLIESLQQRREEYGFNDIVVQGDVMDVFAPIVAKLAGT